MVPHQLRTLFVNGTEQGIGMLQADPTNDEKYVAMFLHSNMIKWSIRDFLCVGCSYNQYEPPAVSAIEKPEYPINRHLTKHSRIFKEEDMQMLGIDPEPLIWRSMEHAACSSVWREADLCVRTRSHMSQTFGYHFQPAGKMGGLLGSRDQICINEG